MRKNSQAKIMRHLGSAKSISNEGGMGKRGMGGESGRVTRRPDHEGLGGQYGTCVSES